MAAAWKEPGVSQRMLTRQVRTDELWFQGGTEPQSIKWRVIEEEIPCQPQVFRHTHARTHTNTHIHTQHIPHPRKKSFLSMRDKGLLVSKQIGKTAIQNQCEVSWSWTVLRLSKNPVTIFFPSKTNKEISPHVFNHPIWYHS